MNGNKLKQCKENLDGNGRHCYCKKNRCNAKEEDFSNNKEDFTASSSIFGFTDKKDIFDFSNSAFRTSEEDANISSPLINKSMYGFVDKKCFVSLYLLTLYFISMFLIYSVLYNK